MEQPEIIVRRAVHAQQMSSAMELLVEQLGAIGIQLLTKELREETLASEKKVRVLRLMALITREQYPEGKLEILRCATQLMQEPTEAVRTAATEAILLSLDGIRRIKQCEHLRQEANKLAGSALRVALERGVRADVAERTAETLKESL